MHSSKENIDTRLKRYLITFFQSIEEYELDVYIQAKDRQEAIEKARASKITFANKHVWHVKAIKIVTEDRKDYYTLHYQQMREDFQYNKASFYNYLDHLKTIGIINLSQTYVTDFNGDEEVKIAAGGLFYFNDNPNIFGAYLATNDNSMFFIKELENAAVIVNLLRNEKKHKEATVDSSFILYFMVFEFFYEERIRLMYEQIRKTILSLEPTLHMYIKKGKAFTEKMVVG